MGSSVQLNLPPRLLTTNGRAEPTSANSLGSDHTTPLVEVMSRAFVICGFTAQQAAGALEMSAADYSKAFSTNWPQRNPIMKRFDNVEFGVRQQFAAILATEYHLLEPDVEQTRILREFANVLKKAVG